MLAGEKVRHVAFIASDFLALSVFQACGESIADLDVEVQLSHVDLHRFLRIDLHAAAPGCFPNAPVTRCISEKFRVAGHYRSVGACPELRFEPLNIHRQCVKCNRNLSGNAVEYRIRLVLRIGAETVAWLEGPHEPRKYTVEEIKTIKAEYRAKTRELKKGQAA